MELKVGQTWSHNKSGIKKIITAVGNSLVLIRTIETEAESSAFLSYFTENHTIDIPADERLKQALADIKYLTEAILDSRLAVIRGDEIRKKYNLK